VARGFVVAISHCCCLRDRGRSLPVSPPPPPPDKSPNGTSRLPEPSSFRLPAQFEQLDRRCFKSINYTNYNSTRATCRTLNGRPWLALFQPAVLACNYKASARLARGAARLLACSLARWQASRPAHWLAHWPAECWVERARSLQAALANSAGLTSKFCTCKLCGACDICLLHCHAQVRFN